MHRTALAVLVILLVAACDGSAGVEAPDSTDPPAVATQDAWPASFETGLCAAMDRFPSVVDHMADLETAADSADADAVVESAQAAVREVRGIDAELESIASDYAPARRLLVAWRRANSSLLKALGDIWNGAEDLDETRLNRGADELARATGLIAETSPLIDDFGAETGFQCDGAVGALPTIMPFGGVDLGPTAKPEPADVYYDSCADARVAGAAPLRRGDAGYRSGLDRDNDGIACEQ